jgi:hypothetical protein
MINTFQKVLMATISLARQAIRTGEHRQLLHKLRCRELARIIGYARFKKIASRANRWPLRGALKQMGLESAS